MKNRLLSEPVLIIGLVQTVLALLLAFGTPLSTEQVAAVLAAISALLALLARALVVPVINTPEV